MQQVQFLCRSLLWVVIAICATSTSLWAQSNSNYPNKPIKLVVGFPPGASSDVVARLLATRLGESLGQPITIENRPGAGSNLGADAVARSAPDGYTLLLTTVANAINATLMPSASFDILRDFAPIGIVASVPNLLVVHPSVNVKSVQELIALAKSKPSSVIYASSGNGTGTHLAAELFNNMADIQMMHVPYKGSPQAVTDLIAGRVMVMFAPTSSVLQHIKAGSLKALATTGAQRTASAPELPTVAESGLAGFEASVWFGLMAPKGTTPDLIERLNRETAKLFTNEKWKEQLAAQGMDPLTSSSEKFAEYLRADTAKWARIIKSAGVKAD